MTESIKLTASLRQEKVRDLKENIPAVVYGSGTENQSLVVGRVDFEKVFKQSGESGLISLKLADGKELPVIVKDVQFEAVKHRIIHVDFFKVNMDETVIAEASINFVGEAPAVKNHGGVVVEHFDHMEIECLPNDLIKSIEIDLSGLENIGDAIHVKDIVLPKGVVSKHEATDVVVNVIELRKKVEEAPVADAAAAAPAADAKSGDKPEEKKEEKK
ncbi:MAG: 50S ribosomal protein L25 [Candidatus Falkowbacteria bacterium]|nr:50S ribosomal protein L25 [Candidatus Falkowbacteria bacterium]